MRRWVRNAVALPVVALCLVVAACGSSSSSGGGGGGGSSSATAQAKSAKATVAKLESRPSTLAVPSLPSKPASGKSIDYVACGLPVCIGFGAYVKAAATAVGWHYKVLNAGLTPQTVASAYSQAVADHPAGVIGSGGFSPSLFTHQLAQLKAAKIPVVLSAVGSAPAGVGLVANAPFQGQNGQEMADWILADSGGHGAHVAIFTSPETPVYAAAHTALQKTIKAPGCTGCSLSTFSFPEGDIGQKLPNEVVSFLTRHPDVNYAYFDFSNEVDGVPAALTTAGLSSKVKIVTTDTTSTESGYLTNNQEAAASAVPWPEMFWGAFNIVLTADAGKSTAAAEKLAFPHMILTGSNLVSKTQQFPLVADYQTAFKKAWHVG